MLFNSLEFALFFTVVVLIYFRIGPRLQLGFLLAASYFFYGWWRWEYTSLLIFSTALDYTIALAVARSKRTAIRKLLLTLSICCNLGVLFFFKYLQLFLTSIATALGWFGAEVAAPNVSETMPWYTLPIGISFYTFQTMSYTIDVYRGVVKPTRNPLKVALFVCYFPQLIAGPVLRSNELMPQMDETHRWDWDRVRVGLWLVMWGLMKKVCLADNLAPFVETAYSDPTGHSGLALLVATYCFAFQIYFDFSGYSDIAIGLAMILGFRLIENFRRPYLAANITDFWRRWHMSLSRWLRDYLYIPLGGNRHGPGRMYVNLMLTMLLGGLWHGASWNFVIWGGLHGVALAVHKVVHGKRVREDVGLNPLKIVLTFHFVCFTWIFFRATDFESAWAVVRGIVTWQGGAPIAMWVPVAIFVGFTIVQLFQEKRGAIHPHVDRAFLRNPWLVGGFVYTLFVLAIAIFSTGKADFIYFQF